MQRWEKYGKKVVYVKELLDLGGTALIIKFSHPHMLLSSVYPEYPWIPWKWARVPKGYWFNPENKQKFIEWAGKELGIKEMSDWYKITDKV